MTPAPLLRLLNNLSVPSVGLGTGKLRGAPGVAAIRQAIDAGYRLFDTAFLYGNEDVVGQAISEKIAEGAVTRRELFVVGKLWGTHHGQVERACRDSCARLGLDYIDLYLIHFPVSFRFRSDEEKWPTPEDCLDDHDYTSVWRAMEGLVDAGLVRHIGMSNFNAQQIRRVFDSAARHKPAFIEMEHHPAFSCDESLELCRELAIQTLAYCPLGRPKPERMEPPFLHDTSVKEIAARHRKSPAQIALRYSIQRGLIPIPKSATPDRIRENIDVFDFQLSDAEMELMRSFHSAENRICRFHFAEASVHYPFK